MLPVLAHRQKLLLGDSFGQNVDLFYKSVDLFNEIEDILWLFKQNSGFLALKLEVFNKILTF